MPAQRGRISQQSDGSKRELRSTTASSREGSAEHVFVATTMSEAPSQSIAELSLADPGMFEFEQEEYGVKRSTSNRKKPANHIPRPPNAFILFRSSFIKNRHVSTEVETNHSTLSKIIGMTWQNLPDGERQKWHARAKLAQEEHKRTFPQYSFRPIHNKAKGAAADKRKLREVGPKDQKRCAKIAELLVCGKKGQELEEAIQEFDKHHVPEIITRFDTPITANTYLSPTSPTNFRSSRSLSPLPSFSRKSSASASRGNPLPQFYTPSSSQLQQQDIASKQLSFDAPSFNYSDSDQSPSFNFDSSFSFSVQQPSPAFLENYTSCPKGSFPSFDTLARQDPSQLCQTAQYPTGMEDWARQSSPLSNSTCSMPSTPAHMTVPFPESYVPFTNDTGLSEYAPLTRGSYHGYSQYPCYAPISDSGYEDKEPELPASGFLQTFDGETLESADGMICEEHTFPSFMVSLDPHAPYSVGSTAHLSFHAAGGERSHL